MDVDDRAAAVAGEDRREGADQQQRPEDVGLVRRPDLLLGEVSSDGAPPIPALLMSTSVSGAAAAAAAMAAGSVTSSRSGTTRGSPQSWSRRAPA